MSDLSDQIFFWWLPISEDRVLTVTVNSRLQCHIIYAGSPFSSSHLGQQQSSFSQIFDWISKDDRTYWEGQKVSEFSTISLERFLTLSQETSTPLRDQYEGNVSKESWCINLTLFPYRLAEIIDYLYTWIGQTLSVLCKSFIEAINVLSKPLYQTTPISSLSSD